MTFEEVAVPPVPPAAEPAPPPHPESEPAENEEEAEAGEDEVEEGAEGPETPAEADGEDLVRAPCHMWPGWHHSLKPRSSAAFVRALSARTHYPP